jgi:hypothetical protein
MSEEDVTQLWVMTGNGVVTDEVREATPADVLAAARGLEGAEVFQRCSVHLADYHDGAPGCEFWMFARVVQSRYGTEAPRPCSVDGYVLVVPLDEGIGE